MKPRVTEPSGWPWNPDGGTAVMTISKKLYLNFGAILSIVVVLFLVNMAAVQREHATHAATGRAVAASHANEALRFQMMQNRLFLNSYLLSGDTRELDKMNDGISRLYEMLKQTSSKASSEQQRASFGRLLESEQRWEQGFVRPLVEKRKQVDGGNATVADLQIYYLQLDPVSWIRSSAS